MRSIIATVLVAFTLATSANAAVEEDAHSGKGMLHYCSLSSRQTMENTRNALMYGQCFGVVSGIALMTEMLRQASSVGKAELDPTLCVAIPGQTTIVELVDTVVKYGQAHPDRTNDRFEILAFSALQNAWPCEK